jgi:predicted enzyme related to lactoylglutathione lyase
LGARETAAQLREFVAKGLASKVFLTTDDCRRTHKQLRARGVEFYESPQQRTYGIDAGFRDPFGNTFRLVQLM